MTNNVTPVSAPHISSGGILSALVRADFTVATRNRRTIVLNLLVPVIVIVVTGISAKHSLGNNGLIIGMATTYGLIASALLGYSMAVAQDRDNGVFQRLRVTPAPNWAIISSRFIVQLVISLAIPIIVLILGGIIHQVAFSVVQWLLTLVLSLLGAAMFLAIGQVVVTVLRTQTAVNAIGRVLYIALILVGITGPTGLLGTAFQTFSYWTPVGALMSLYSLVLEKTAWASADTYGIIAIVAYIVVCSFVGIRWFRWEAK